MNPKDCKGTTGYNVSLSLMQLYTIQGMMEATDYLRVVIESTNLDGVVAVRLDGRITLVSTSGATFDVS